MLLISDLFNKDNTLKPFAFWMNKGLSAENFLLWAGLVSSVKKHSHVRLADTLPAGNATNIPLSPDHLTYADSPLTSLTPKLIYRHLINIKCGASAHIPKITKYANIPTHNWTVHYQTAHRIPLDTKTREFQFKFLHDLLINNFWLKKWNLAESDQCTFCKQSSENILHLFWQCDVIQSFWKQFNDPYSTKTNTEVELSNVICGTQDSLFCTLILTAKKYIYECRFNETIPDVHVFKRKVNYVKTTEFEIAKRNVKMLRYIEKWEPLEDL